MALGERRCVRGFLCPHVDRSSATSNVSNKAGGWLDHARRSDSHEDRAFAQCAEDAIQVERHFAEPTDVWANPSAAAAPWKFGWRIVGIRVMKQRSVASITAALEKLAVHVDGALRPCLLMQVINVLRAEKHVFLQLLFELCKCGVRRVRLCRSRDTTAHGIELPYERGIATPRVGRGDFFDPVVPPETIDATERRYPALGAYACPCEDEEAIMGRNGKHVSVYAAPCSSSFVGG